MKSPFKKSCSHKHLLQIKHNANGTPIVGSFCFDCDLKDYGVVYGDSWETEEIVVWKDGKRVWSRRIVK